MHKIHLFGASGSGTSTIGRALAAALDLPYLDTDDFFWEKTPIPFEIERPPERRIALLRQAMEGQPGWVLGGSLLGWGDVFLPEFTLAIFVYTEPKMRIERIRRREAERYGDDILPGGPLYEKSREFVAWAASYDTSTESTSRNLGRHRAWLESIPCPALELDGARPVEESLRSILHSLE